MEMPTPVSEKDKLIASVFYHPKTGFGSIEHRSASRSRSRVRDRADSYKDMYLREANLNVTLRSENALLRADIVRLKSLATDDRTSANLN